MGRSANGDGIPYGDYAKGDASAKGRSGPWWREGLGLVVLILLHSVLVSVGTAEEVLPEDEFIHR
jgi:hypothetical protein